MRRNAYIALTVVIALVCCYGGWKIFGPSTNFSGHGKYLYIHSGKNTPEEVARNLSDSNYFSATDWFLKLYNLLRFPKKIYPGKYEIKKHTSIWSLLIRIRNNNQSPVKLTITKVRTKEQLADFLGDRFESDSVDFIHFMNDSQQLASFGLDTTTIITAVLPNTYELLWTSSPEEVFKKLWKENRNFWTEARIHKAESLGLDPVKVYILASIIEEETTLDDDKDTIASIYLNRLKKGMRLQADPTVKFALRDFGLKRIYEKHLEINSPYNTYRYEGLPPGPICTPSYVTLEAVLNAPPTRYLYFVAKSDFSGKHLFSETYEEHLNRAKAFQRAQDVQQRIRQLKQENPTRP